MDLFTPLYFRAFDLYPAIEDHASTSSLFQKVPRPKPFWRIGLLVGICIFYTAGVMAQSSTCVPGMVENMNADDWSEECYLNDDCEEQGNPCQANDVALVGVFIADSMGNPIPACNIGDSQTVTLWGNFSNGTGTNRYAVRARTELFINGSFSQELIQCAFDLLPSGIDSFALLGTFSYTCGDQIQLVNTWVAWSTSAAQCSDPVGANYAFDCGDYSPSKCSKNLGFISFLTPNFSYECGLFTSTTTEVCFTDESFGGFGPIVSWDWDFGDGGMSTDTNPCHTYNFTTGMFVVTLTVTDSAGNVAGAFLEIDLDSLNCCGLEISCPPMDGGTFTCITEIPAADTTLVIVTDSCGPVTTTVQNSQTGSGCGLDTLYYTRLYIVTDGVTTDTCTQLFKVRDSVIPDINCPSDITIQCNTSTAPAATGSATATDNCDASPSVTYSDSVSPGACTQEMTITRTWIATDDCGNTNFCDQIITVDDSMAPGIICPPNVTIQCNSSTAPADTGGSASATDNCDTAPSITFSDSVAPGACSQEMTITRTWVATDECGNASSCTQTITVDDSVAPLIISCPADVTIDCTASTDPADTGGFATATDNCDTAPTITYSDAATAGGCAQEYVITRTWIASDACGNSSTCAQLITVDDSMAPSVVCPPDVTIECNTSTAPANTGGTATATDNCDPSPSVSFSDSVAPGACAQEMTITRTWWATDACGNSSTPCTQTITVDDSMAPTVVCPPDVTIECNTSTAPADTGGPATATDNCDPMPSVSFSDVTTPGNCAQEMTILRTWWATDACGNSSTPCTQTITVDDSMAPGIMCPPDVTIECNASTDPADTGGFATATDNCDTAPTITYSDAATGGGCPQEFVIIRTWIAMDACGNTSTCSQLITVDDSMAPTVVCPPDVTIECNTSTAPANTGGMATATDNCDTSPSISFSDSVAPGACAQEMTITRTWWATDACGNSSTPCTQTITVDDSMAPTVVCPPDVTIECNTSTAPADTGGPASATDNCDPMPSVSFSDATTPGNCAQEITILRTWWATDACGNSSTTCTQTITVDDSMAPGIMCPPDVTIECNASTDPANTGGFATATDNCDTAPTITYTDAVAPGNCTQEFVITRTWMAMDACGNTSTCTQLITADDNMAPTVVCPPDVTIECNTSTAPANTGGMATATDNCDTSPSISFSDSVAPGACAQEMIITRTWWATDDCGNSSTPCTQTITVDDSMAPTVVCPPDVTIECNTSTAPANTGGMATATDNCDPSPSVSFSDSVAPGACAQEMTITRTWWATDACGNSSTPCTQTITVDDSMAPVVTCPPNVTVECNTSTAPADTGGPATATDNCDPMPSVSFSDATTPGNCAQEMTILRTWWAVDACGNSSNTCTQLIAVDDSTAPTITCPADITIDCAASTAPGGANGSATATDNCDPSPSITYSDVVTSLVCPQELLIIRTWTATDDCGNVGSCTQQITTEDNQSPTIACPPDITVSCGTDTSPGGVTGMATASDNCNPNPIITSSDVVTTGVCPGEMIIIRTWSATDACGNTSSCTQTISTFDNQAPAISCPADVTINCEDSTSPEDLGEATATDLCDPNPVIMSFDYVGAPPLGAPEMRWVFLPEGAMTGVGQFACTSETNCSTNTICFGLQYTPNTTGTLTSYTTGFFVDCFNGANPIVSNESCVMADNSLVLDDCGGSGTVLMNSSGNSGDLDITQCIPIILHQVCFQLGAGGSVQVVEDVITNLTTSIDLPGGGNTTEEPAYTSYNVVYDQYCGDICLYPSTIYRQFLAVDECGNKSTCVQAITLQDITAPTISCPIDLTVECNTDTSPATTGTATAMDNCDTNPTVTYTEVVTGGNCPQEMVIVRTWTATDACDNVNTCTQTIVVDDSAAPAIVCPPSVTINCTESTAPGGPNGMATATDNCDSAPIVTYTDVVTPGICSQELVVTRIWSATDDCENQSTCVQTITVDDSMAPAIICPPSITIECSEGTEPGGATGMASATDDCDTSPNITSSDAITEGACPQEMTILRTWIATDDCGNSSNCTQLITVIDTEAPMVTCPPNVTVNCDESTSPGDLGMATATDGCDPTPSVLSFDYIGDPPGTPPEMRWVFLPAGTVTGPNNCVSSSNCSSNTLCFGLEYTPGVTGTLTSYTTGFFVDCFNGNNPILSNASCVMPDNSFDIADCGGSGTVLMNSSGNTGNLAITQCIPIILHQVCFQLGAGGSIDIVEDVITDLTASIDLPGGGITTETPSYSTYTVDYDIYCGEACPYPLTIYRQFVAMDDCGNKNTCIQEITVQDITAPSISCPPDVTIECNSDTSPDSNGSASATDNCDASPAVTYTDAVTAGNCQQEMTIVRTWTATDDCGNAITCTQNIVVDDNAAPTIMCPADVTIECDESTVPSPAGGPTGYASATDICDPDPTLTYTDAVVPGNCPQEMVITRTWTATDDCGNQSSCTQTITVDDSMAPVITCPPDVTLECSDSTAPGGSNGTATATDNCDPNPVITYTDAVTQFGCDQSMLIVRVWSATDACGNQDVCTQLLTMDDNTPPAITCPPDVTIECTESTTPGPLTGVASATDNCDPMPVITWSDMVEFGECPEERTITRTWWATDACGNSSSSCTQVINVDDTVAPIITCPPDLTIECDESTAPGGANGLPTATDNCDPSPSFTFADAFDESQQCLQEYILIRTWFAIDNCGNISSCQQQITVDDSTAPVMSCPADVTLECDQSTAPGGPAGMATATDNCDSAPVVTSTDVVTPGQCIQEMIIVRTWTATDACGNSTICTQTITVDDSTAPVITCPPDIVIECTDSTLPPATGVATATDNCDGGVPLPEIWINEFHYDNTGTDTGEFIEVAGPAGTDLSVYEIVLYNGANGLVYDTDPLVGVLPNQSSGFGTATLSYPVNGIQNGSPDGIALVKNGMTVIQFLSYEGSFTAVDGPAMGMMSTDIGVSESGSDPVGLSLRLSGMGTMYSDFTWNAPAAQTPGAVNTGQSFGLLADTGPDISYSDVITGGICPQEYIITRTWTAEDDCGNSSSCTQTITVDDSMAPSITCPPNLTLECTESTAPGGANGTATATDNCDPMPVITSMDIVTTGACPQEMIIIRIWSATDACGNTSTCTQVITVDDSMAPMITCPPDVTIECTVSTAPAAGGPTGFATATDNCDPTPTITWTDVVTPGACPQEMIITRTWTATDDCQNVSTCTQTITVDDSMAPVIICPADVIIECTESTAPSPAGGPTGFAFATDNCDTSPTITWNDVVTPGACPQEMIITRTWTATDDCQNVSTCTQIITVDDSMAPVISCPADVTLECTESTAPTAGGPPGFATATDNCDTSPTITWSDVVTPGACPQEMIITRTWTATDDCQNVSTCTQTITVDDSMAPVITCPPNVTIECTESTVPSAGGPTGFATATDNCDPTPTITWTDIVTPGACPQEMFIIRIWTAADDCQNISTCTQTITVDDSMAPTIACPPDMTIECTESTIPAAGSPTGFATATDNCDPTPTITWMDVVTPGACPQEMIIVRTWTATDDCQNVSSCTQTITVDDSMAPMISCPPSVTIECTVSTAPAAGGPTGFATATDNCDTSPTITWTDVVTPGSCPQEMIIIRTWTATDDCQNVSTCTQSITVDDSMAPVITCPADVTIECDESTAPAAGGPLGVATATDNCDPMPVVTSSDMTGDLIALTLSGTEEVPPNASPGTGSLVGFYDPGTLMLFVDIQFSGLLAPTTAAHIHGPATPGMNAGVQIGFVGFPTGVTAGSYQNTYTLTAAQAAMLTGGLMYVNIHTTLFPGGEIRAQFSIDPCDNLIKRTWTATDACDNTSTCTQLITIVDSTPPTITFCPPNITIECTASTDPAINAALGTATATDNCSAVVTITYSDVVTPGACPQEMTITRTWTADDGCDNTSSCTQIITVDDSMAPVITCPANLTIECDVDTTPGGPTGMATATDNCDPMPVITYTDIVIPGECPQEMFIIRIWSATDACGNGNTCTQTILVDDTMAPMITCAPDVTIECDESTSPDNTGVTTATDNCDPEPTITSIDNIIANETCPANYLIQRTWIVTDACGNSVTCLQNILVDDTTPPDIMCPPDVTLDCFQSTAPSPITDVVLTYSNENTFLMNTGGLNLESFEDNMVGVPQDVIVTVPFTLTLSPSDAVNGVYNTEATGSHATHGDNYVLTQTGFPNTEGTATFDFNSSINTFGINLTDWGDFGAGTLTFSNDAGDVYVVAITPQADGNEMFFGIINPGMDFTQVVLTQDITGESYGIDEIYYGTTSQTGIATATDNCDPEPFVDYVDVVIPGICPQEFTVIRTWTATDDCLNSSSCTQIISVEDNIPPIFTVCPADVTIECDESTSPDDTGTASATDFCDAEVDIVLTENVIPGNCPQEMVIERTWTATDDCGNSSTCFQVVTVVDLFAPTITCPPDLTIECTESTAPGGANGVATATDNCDPQPVVTNTDVVIPGNCPQEMIIIRTWTATDACMNVSSCTQIITVDDSMAPAITCPPDLTLECDESTIPDGPAGFATATDNCDPNPVVTWTDNILPSQLCPQEMIITRTWTATDACGNANTCTQIITVDDTMAPVITCPADVTIECTESTAPSAAGGPTGYASATDNCDPEPDITWTDVVTPGACPQEMIITRTWTAADDCQNASSCTQIITVDDSMAPVITCPPDVTIECTESTAPAAGGPLGFATATDNCDTEPDVTWTDVVTPGACPQEMVITRTWTATDDCQNVSSCTQVITVDDSMAPVITCPPDLTIECDESTSPDNTGIATATDNCDPTPTVTNTDFVIPGNCPQEMIIIRTWTATDDCQNVSSCTQIITVDDSMAPVINCPANLTIECDVDTAPGGPTGAATATDNCDPMPVITSMDIVIPGECPEEMFIIRIWSATDACGNATTCTQTILVDDTMAPMITCAPDVTIECDESTSPDNTGFTTATDNCDTEPFVTWSDVVFGVEDCIPVSMITRTWTAEDNCGNSVSCVQVITIVDSTPPDLMCPPDVTLECNQSTLPSNVPDETTTYTDELTFLMASGNLDMESFEDNMVGTPQWTIVTPGFTVTLEPMTFVTTGVYNVPINGSFATDGENYVRYQSDANETATFDFNMDINSFGINITDWGDFGDGTLTFSNDAGDVFVVAVTPMGDGSHQFFGVINPDMNFNQVVFTQSIPGEAYGFDEIYFGMTTLPGFATATDNCDPEPFVTYSDVVIPGECPQEFVVERTWTATDDCLNSSTCLQIISVEDNTPPVFTECPADVTIECDESTSPDNTGTASATDFCDPEITLTNSDVVIEGECPQEMTIERTWIATDDCGNTSTCFQVIMVIDTVAPMITCPPDTVIDCHTSSDPMSTGFATATDNCDPEPFVTYTEFVFEGKGCPDELFIFRTWTATDACGNSSSCEQFIFVQDTTPPMLTCPPDMTVECTEDTSPANTGSGTATDNCDTEVDVTFMDVIIPGECPQEYTIIRTWTAEDNCFNVSTCDQIITVDDSTPPFILCPGDITVECATDVPEPNTEDVTATDNCGFPTITFVGDVTVNQICANQFMVERTYMAEDECGNTSTCIQSITVFDDTPPTMTCPMNITVECATDVPAPNPALVTATDNCGGPPVITHVGDVTVNQTCANRFDLQRTYQAADECGNTTTCVQVITVFDDTPPSITCPANVTVQCASQVPPVNTGSVSTSDNCTGPAPVVTHVSDVTVNMTCVNRFMVNRTYRSTDACGNSATCVQVITVFDSTPPSITCPANVTVQCATQVPPVNTGSVTATDNCTGPAPVITHVSDVTINQTCPNRFNLIRTYRATDACGNSATCAQTIVVFDNTPPTITCPANITVECANDVPAPNPGSVTAMDNCTPGPPTVTFVSDVTINQTCINRFTLIRTYRATDACGNSATCTQTIVVFDDTPPTIEFVDPLLENIPNGGTLEVQCYGQDPEWEPPMFGPQSVSVMDNCPGPVTTTYDETLVDEGDCDVDGYINRYRLTWTATDACGNSSTAFVFINLVDTIPPVILGVPADITVDCDEIPEPPILMAVDECLCACVVELVQDGPDPGCQDGQVVVRTWKATDDCGNMTFESQFITLIDDEGPVIELVDPNVAGLPDGTILDFTCNEGGIPDYFDDLNAESVYSPPVCDGFPNITFDEEIHVADRNCKFFGYIEQRIYTWTGVDACGNDSTFTLTVRLVDTEPPVIIGAPLFACVGDPVLDDVYAEDNCQDVGVYYWDVPIPNPCGEGTAFRRTWEAVDPCGNYERDTTILLPDDDTPPEMTLIHPELLFLGHGEVLRWECEYDGDQYTQFGVDDVLVEDECPLGLEVTYEETVVIEDDCDEGRILRLLAQWTATDLCGNSASLYIYIDIMDETPPVLENFDSEVTIGCNDELPEINVYDNCGTVELVVVDSIVPGPCAYIYDVIRMITVTDWCGNVTEATQVVHVGDGSGPIIEGVVEEICDDLSIPDVTAWDACAEQYVEVTMTQDTLDVPCKDGIVIQRIWTATDICGNVSTAVQTIYINDHTPPEIQIPTWSIILDFLDQEPNLVFLSKEDIIDQLNDLDESSVYVVDDCDQLIIPEFSVVVTYADDCEEDGYYEHRVYTWIATDACGNSSVITFSVSIMDDIPPAISGNFDELIVICAPLPPPTPVEVSDYGTPVDLVYNQVIGPDNGQGEFVVERTWTATDPCGNVTVAKQTILWIPNTFVDCDILLPPAVECNSHGVVIGSNVTGGIGPFTYEWEVIGEKCFIQSGQGTPTITIYVGFSEVLISLTVTDAYGCSGICQATLDCIDPFDDTFQGLPVDIDPETEEPGVLIPAVNQGQDQLRGLRYWPNPAHASLNLQFIIDTEGEVEIVLTNFLGQIVHRDEMDATKGINHRRIDVSDIPDGTYLLRVKKDDVIHAKPVVIIHNR